MKKSLFTIQIEAEQNNSVLIKILSGISRRLLKVTSFSVHLQQNENLLLIDFSFEDLEENVFKFSKFLEKQVDIISVSFFKHQIQTECKTEHQKSFSTL